jgi:prepilin-type N-terminal cleavage/methylation domain-containing protein
MHKKKGFTLVELVLVMSILALMSLIWARYLSSLDADRAYTEGCTNAVFSDLADWVYYASTSRVLSWDIIPTYYILEIDGTWYNFKYWTWDIRNGNWIQYLSRHIEDFYYCRQSRNYHNVIKTDFSQIKMLPWLVPDWDQSWFKIVFEKDSWICWKNNKLEKNLCSDCTQPIEQTIDGNVKQKFCSVWSLVIKFCPKSDVESACVEYGQIYFDARTWMVKKRLCKKYRKDDGKKCETRTTWR